MQISYRSSVFLVASSPALRPFALCPTSLLGRCEDEFNAAATAQTDGLLPCQVLFGTGRLASYHAATVEANNRGAAV